MANPTKPTLAEEPGITVRVLGKTGQLENRHISYDDLAAGMERGRFREGDATARLEQNARGQLVLRT